MTIPSGQEQHGLCEAKTTAVTAVAGSPRALPSDPQVLDEEGSL